MSEYQYYEFQAIDRPLTQAEMGRLRDISTRATITPSSFTNAYSWGDLKANPNDLLGKYFDAFLYVANWGTHRLAFRMPMEGITFEQMREYDGAEGFSVRRKGEHVVVDFSSESESGEWEGGEGMLAGLISLRADILHGDMRALYLGWLMEVQEGLVDEDQDEPPVPPGLGSLSAPLKALVEFLRLDEDLVEAAAQASERLTAPSADEEAHHAGWLGSLGQSAKDAWLARAAKGDAGVQWEMRKAYSSFVSQQHPKQAGETPRRSVAALQAACEVQTEGRRVRAGKAKADRARKDAAARRKYLLELNEKRAATQREIKTLIAASQAAPYDRAVKLLVDLRDAAALKDDDTSFSRYLAGLRADCSRKKSFLAKLRNVGL